MLGERRLGRRSVERELGRRTGAGMLGWSWLGRRSIVNWVSERWSASASPAGELSETLFSRRWLGGRSVERELGRRTRWPARPASGRGAVQPALAGPAVRRARARARPASGALYARPAPAGPAGEPSRRATATAFLAKVGWTSREVQQSSGPARAQASRRASRDPFGRR